jgi:hypothetical protein
MLRLVDLIRTDVSEEHIALIIVFLLSVLRLLATNISSSPIFVTLMMVTIRSSETLVLDVFPFSGNRRKEPTLLGHLERANLNYWTFKYC